MGVPRLAMFSGPQELAGHLAEADRILAEIPTGSPAAPELQCLLLETLSDPGPGLGQRLQGQGWGGLWRKGRGEPPTWGPAGGTDRGLGDPTGPGTLLSGSSGTKATKGPGACSASRPWHRGTRPQGCPAGLEPQGRAGRLAPGLWGGPSYEPGRELPA